MENKALLSEIHNSDEHHHLMKTGYCALQREQDAIGARLPDAESDQEEIFEVDEN